MRGETPDYEDARQWPDHPRGGADAHPLRQVPGDHLDRAEEGGGSLLQREVGVQPEGLSAPEWRIIASHPDSAHPVTLYITPYERLATQEWLATERVRSTLGPGDSDLHDHRLQVRVEGEWQDVARA